MHESDRGDRDGVRLDLCVFLPSFRWTQRFFYKGHFRALLGRPLLGSLPVSFSTVALVKAGLKAGLHHPPASIEPTPLCVTWCG
jgi:hypothetical protein